MTMIEQVARAIAKSDGFEFDNCLKTFQSRVLNEAKAAIEAMRVPTDEMQIKYYELNHKTGTFDISTWERSIDAALME